MRVDLTLLVPSWVLQYDTWREFLEVIEQSVNAIAENVDDLKELYDVEKAKEFVVLLARNFGFRELVYQDVEKNVQLLDNQVGFIQWKGSEEFFKWLMELFEMSVVFRDLSKEVLIWSGGRGWDRHVIEDAKYYRDGSVEVTIPVSQFWAMKELERFVSAGVYVWYMVIAGLQMLGIGSRVSEVEVGAGFGWREVVKVSIRYRMEEGRREVFEVRGSFYGVKGVPAWGVGSGELSIDVGLGGVGVVGREVVGGMFKIGVSEDFSLKEGAESRLFTKSDNRYIVVNESVVILS